MPEKKTRARAQAAKKRGDKPSTQAGEYVREEIHHIREGKHGAKSAKQAIAIGLSKARRDGVKAPAKKGAKKTAAVGKSGSHAHKKVSAKRSAAAKSALKRQPRAAASHRALSRHAKKAARTRK